MKKFIKSILFLLVLIVSINITFLIFAEINKYNFKLYYKKVSNIFTSSDTNTAIKTNQINMKKPKIYSKKRFSILDRGNLLSSRYVPEVLSLSDLTNTHLTNVKIKLNPKSYTKELRKDDEWTPLPETKDSIKHKLDWQFPEWETQLRVYGRQILGFSYGWAMYLEKPKFAEANAHSSVVNKGFKPKQSLEIHIKGKVGKKVTIDIDSSGRQEVDTYKVAYKAVKKREFIQNITAGNIGVSIPGSSYAAGGGGGNKSAFGIKAVAQKGDFKYQAIASMTRGITEVKHFKGTSQLMVKDIRDMDFIKKKYYILNNGNPIQTGSLIIYLDDENGNNNFGTTTLPYYDKKSGTWETNDCDLLYSGVDYIIDYERGLLIFKRGISANYDIFVSYNKPSGANSPYLTTTDTNSAYSAVVTNSLDNRQYVFLQRKATVSPFEYKGIYYIGNQNIQKNDKDFKFSILDKDHHPLSTQPFSEINSETYHGGGTGYYIDEVSGYIIFDSSTPFYNFSDSYYASHTNESIYGYNPLSEYSHYYIHLEYRYESRRFQLHWDLIKNSEKVFVNGRKLVRDKDYTIDYTTGNLEFIKNRVTITPDSDIDIVYEYLPFGGGLQQILAGLRIEYTPAAWLSFGSVGFYNGRQSPARVPSPKNATDNRWVGSIFGKANFTEEILKNTINDVFSSSVSNVPVSFSVNGEYAGSYYNINTFGQAMVDDFEGTVESMSISVREGDWYLSAARGAGDETIRGKLLYKDYRDYDDNEKLQPLSWGNEHTVDYTVKPGPYNVNEGHLDTSQLPSLDTIQRSLVLDYDFSGGKTWAGLIRRTAYGGGGRDFRNYTDLVLWVRLVSTDPTAKVKLHIDIGKFSEDLDGDGILDKETSKNDGGFRFNPTGGIATWLGGGPKWTPSGQNYLVANGGIDTEDLDRNGYLDTIQNEEIISLPGGVSSSGAVYSKTEDGQNDLTVSAGQWQMVRITISKDLMDTDLQDLLKRIKHIRIRIEKDTGDTGQLLINSIYFSGLTWHNVYVNDEPSVYSNQNYFKVYPINTFDDATYNENSLRNNDPDAYDDLHGPITEEEAAQQNEQALVLEYNNLSKHNFSLSISSNYQLNGNNYTCGYVSRTYSSAFDIRYYKKIKVWVYVPASVHPVGEYFFVRFGGTTSYYEYREKLDWVGWKQVVIDLRSDEFKNLNPRDNTSSKYNDTGPWRVVNIPNLKLINYVALGIYGSPSTDGATGQIWVNDLYLDEVQKLSDKAYSVSGGFSIRNHFSGNISYSYRGKDFSSIGGFGSGTESESLSLGGNWSTISWLPVHGSWAKSISKSDIDEIFVPINQQGYSVSKNWSIGGSLNMKSMPGIRDFYPQYWPNIGAGYSTSISSNRKPLSWLESGEYKTMSYSKGYSWNINGSEKPPFFDTLLGINVNGQGGYSFSLSENRSFNYVYSATNETGYTVSTNYSAGRNDSYNIGGSISAAGVNLSPRYNYSRSLSKNNYKTNAWNLNSRSRSFSTGLSTPKILIITPSINYNLSYSESGFHYKNNGRTKFELSQYDSDTNLFKNANTSQNLSLSIGSFNIDWFIFKTFTPSYSKGMGFSQSDVSVISNTMLNTFAKFGDSFLLRLPGQYFYIPYIYPHYKSFEFVRQYKEDNKTSLSFRNSFSARWGLEFSKLSFWSFSYSLNQNTSRSYSSYSISQSWSLSASSSLDLMKIFNFFIWRKSKEYAKSSSISYGTSYRRSNNFLQKSVSQSIAPNLSFNYRWRADKAIGFSSSFSFSESKYEAFEEFYKILEDDYGYKFRDELEPKNVIETPPKRTYNWRFSTSYSFSSDLAEYWTPPLFFKKPWHLGYKLNHSISLSFSRTTYDYGTDDKTDKDYIHPKEMLAQISLNYSLSFNISKNIDGGAHGKLVYENTRTERGEPGNEDDDKEQIGSWEIGVKATIRF